MLGMWIVGGGIFLSIGLIAISVILTISRKGEGRLERIFARQDKIDALIESAKLWYNIGIPYEAEACISEASRLSAEVQMLIQGLDVK